MSICAPLQLQAARLMCGRMCVRVGVGVGVGARVRVRTQMCALIYVYVYAYVHAYVYVHVHVYTYSYVHIHAYIYICLRRWRGHREVHWPTHNQRTESTFGLLLRGVAARESALALAPPTHSLIAAMRVRKVASTSSTVATAVGGVPPEVGRSLFALDMAPASRVSRLHCLPHPLFAPVRTACSGEDARNHLRLPAADAVARQEATARMVLPVRAWYHYDAARVRIGTAVAALPRSDWRPLCSGGGGGDAPLRISSPGPRGPIAGKRRRKRPRARGRSRMGASTRRQDPEARRSRICLL